MDFWAITDRGIVRKQNQDTCYTSEQEGAAFLAVCDGMGGANAGDVASRLAMTVFTEEVKRRLTQDMSGEELEKLMEQAAVTANSAVYELSITDRDCCGMGTTMVAAVVRNGEATVMNIGDSRGYSICNGTIVQVTRDHSVVEDMIMRGEITREQSRFHPNKNLITRALGTAPDIECDFFNVRMEKGDMLLLCSDGLSNMVTDRELLETAERESTPEPICKKLLDMALQRGAPDNVTVVLYRE